MLNSYLNQTAVYRSKTGTSDRGQPIYGEPMNIPCRKQDKAQNVLMSTAQTVRTQHIYYCKNTVNEGDMLDDKIVTAVSVWRGLGGEILGFKAVM